ncbi:MAG: hypothetical protein AAGI22_24445 [Planctomycetota bacterium]
MIRFSLPTLLLAAPFVSCASPPANDPLTDDVAPALPPGESAAESFVLPDVRVDHVLVSLSPARFEALSEFLAMEFGEPTWNPLPDRGKGFLGTRTNEVYIEFWDDGGPGINGPVGNMVAVSGSDTALARRRAQDYYGFEGIDYTELGAPGLFTVGSEFAAGHPVGGVFYVEYGDGPPRDVGEVGLEALREVVLALPAHRMDEADTYRAFGFTERAIDGGGAFTDTNGIDVRLPEVPSADMLGHGPYALRFGLVDPVDERTEVPIGDESLGLLAVFDGSDLWLVFRPDRFEVPLAAR